MLLSGYQPFYAQTVGDLIQLIKRGEFEFSGTVWASISDSAKDLVKSLLASDPAQRANVHDALAHQWFTNPEPIPKRRFSGSEFLKNLTRHKRQLTRRKISGPPTPWKNSDPSQFPNRCRLSMHLKGANFDEFFND